MSHRQTSRATHSVLVRRRTEVETGYGNEEYGDDPYGGDPFDDEETTMEIRYLALDANDELTTVDTADDATPIPVGLNPGGSSYVRGDTGVRVEEADSVRWSTDYFPPKEGDRLVFDDLGERLVEGVTPRHGRHGLAHYELELGGT